MSKPAGDGDAPVRQEALPYGRQSIDEHDIEAVVEVLRSDWLTTGPTVDAFEQAVADYVGAAEGIAVSNGTAALHTAMRITGIGQGDEVIVPAMTFAATANAALYEGARPVFADVQPDTLLIDPEEANELITPRTRAIVPVDYTGHPCDYDALRELADDHDLILIADACHAIGARYKGRPVGSLADATCFSFHPVKHITTGEGGMVTTENEGWAEHGRRFRHHGMVRDLQDEPGWAYEIPELGCNYRLTDFQCALGLSQLNRLPTWLEQRRRLASAYDRALAKLPGIEPLTVRKHDDHAYHLYVVRVTEDAGIDRDTLYRHLHAASILVAVHYPPVHLQPLYRRLLDTGPGMLPRSEAVAEEILTLPLHSGMEAADIDRVVGEVAEAIRKGDA